MMMVVRRTVLGGRAVVMELAAAMIVIGVMVCGIQRNIGEHHMLMVLITDDCVLNAADRTGHRRLAEDKQQADAKHRRNLP